MKINQAATAEKASRQPLEIEYLVPPDRRVTVSEHHHFRESLRASTDGIDDLDGNEITEAILPTPIRVKLSRKKGWRLPPNTMSVARPHAMGNPHNIGFCPTCGVTHTREEAIAKFEALFIDNPSLVATTILAIKGKNLACWCKLNEPCHADFLLRLANPQPEATNQ